MCIRDRDERLFTGLFARWLHIFASVELHNFVSWLTLAVLAWVKDTTVTAILSALVHREALAGVLVEVEAFWQSKVLSTHCL